jgi:putative membrane protein insertion efficiency factor
MKNKSFFYIIFYPLLLVQKGLIYIYKFCISPLLPSACRFKPTCSTYFLQAVDEYGVFEGFLLGTKRILRCNPFSKGGYDPLKPNIKGKIKWIL